MEQCGRCVGPVMGNSRGCEKSVHHRKGAYLEKVNLLLRCLFPGTTGCSLGSLGSCSVWHATQRLQSSPRPLYMWPFRNTQHVIHLICAQRAHECIISYLHRAGETSEWLIACRRRRRRCTRVKLHHILYTSWLIVVLGCPPIGQ